MKPFTFNCPGVPGFSFTEVFDHFQNMQDNDLLSALLLSDPHTATIDLDADNTVVFDKEGHFYCVECAGKIAERIEKTSLIPTSAPMAYQQLSINRCLKGNHTFIEGARTVDVFKACFAPFKTVYQQLSAAHQIAALQNPEQITHINFQGVDIAPSQVVTALAATSESQLASFPVAVVRLIRAVTATEAGLEQLDASINPVAIEHEFNRQRPQSLEWWRTVSIRKRKTSMSRVPGARPSLLRESPAAAAVNVNYPPISSISMMTSDADVTYMGGMPFAAASPEAAIAASASAFFDNSLAAANISAASPSARPLSSGSMDEEDEAKAWRELAIMPPWKLVQTGPSSYSVRDLNNGRDYVAPPTANYEATSSFYRPIKDRASAEQIVNTRLNQNIPINLPGTPPDAVQPSAVAWLKYLKACLTPDARTWLADRAAGIPLSAETTNSTVVFSFEGTPASAGPGIAASPMTPLERARAHPQTPATALGFQMPPILGGDTPLTSTETTFNASSLPANQTAVTQLVANVAKHARSGSPLLNQHYQPFGGRPAPTQPNAAAATGSSSIFNEGAYDWVPGTDTYGTAPQQPGLRRPFSNLGYTGVEPGSAAPLSPANAATYGTNAPARSASPVSINGDPVRRGSRRQSYYWALFIFALTAIALIVGLWEMLRKNTPNSPTTASCDPLLQNGTVALPEPNEPCTDLAAALIKYSARNVTNATVQAFTQPFGVLLRDTNNYLAQECPGITPPFNGTASSLSCWPLPTDVPAIINLYVPAQFIIWITQNLPAALLPLIIADVTYIQRLYYACWEYIAHDVSILRDVQAYWSNPAGAGANVTRHLNESLATVTEYFQSSVYPNVAPLPPSAWSQLFRRFLGR